MSKLKNNRKFKVFLAILKFSLLLVIIIGIPLYIYFFQKDLIETMSSFENVKAYFADHKGMMALVYLGLQAVQIIICIIPGGRHTALVALCRRIWLANENEGL